jgi:putative oxidoreductase
MAYYPCFQRDRTGAELEVKRVTPVSTPQNRHKGAHQYEGSEVLSGKTSLMAPGRSPKRAEWSFQRFLDSAAKLLMNAYVVFAMRLMLAGVFLVSGLGKLIDIDRYSINAVYEFNILPDVLARSFGTALPFVEVFCAVGLLLGIFTRVSSGVIALLSLSFLIAKSIVLLRGQDLICGCFGPITSVLTSVSIFADPPIIFASLVIIFSPPAHRNRFSLVARLPRK